MSVRRERVATKTTRSRVVDNSFYDLQHRGSQPSSSTSRSRLSQACTSLGHKSSNDAPASEVPKVQEEPAIDAPLESYPKCPFDISLLHFYEYHAPRHVWKEEVCLFSFAIHMFSTK